MVGHSAARWWRCAKKLLVKGRASFGWGCSRLNWRGSDLSSSVVNRSELEDGRWGCERLKRQRKRTWVTRFEREFWVFRRCRSPFLGWSRFAGDWASPEDLHRLEVWPDLLKPVVHSDDWSESGRERDDGERRRNFFKTTFNILCKRNLKNKYVITHIKWNNLINILCPFLT